MNTLPLNNAVGAVALGTDSRNVDTVFVAGQPRKWAGRLVDHDIAAVRDLVIASRGYLVQASGYDLNIVGWSLQFVIRSKRADQRCKHNNPSGAALQRP